MSIKAALSVPFARYITNKIRRGHENPLELQRKVFLNLIRKAKDTKFGRDHNFKEIDSYQKYKDHVPVRDYEQLKSYFDLVVAGEEDILWPGRPVYLSKTSGTTSGMKYIPISKDSLPSHINSARNALLFYIAETKRADFVDGKMIFLQGSPVLNKVNGNNVGRLSGIAAHHVPKYLQRNRLPSYNTNCIEDWETKVEAIIDETINEKMTLISGIPSWVQMYFERILERKKGMKVGDIFPYFSLFVYGGVNFAPYKQRFQNLIGRHVDSIELYPASEGFIAYQDSQKDEGMMLVLDGGIFYEFIPLNEIGNEEPSRLALSEVEIGVNYVIILNTNAGLWGYNIGDTIKFVSTMPYRLVVTGRVKHFISAFGEHVIGEEVEGAIREVASQYEVQITEFTVAPQINPTDEELPYHEWFIEFFQMPKDLDGFKKDLDNIMTKKNGYYYDLINGSILQPLKIRRIKKGGFNEFMKARGKLGGQNKIPRLSNDRVIANELLEWIEG